MLATSVGAYYWYINVCYNRFTNWKVSSETNSNFSVSLGIVLQAKVSTESQQQVSTGIGRQLGESLSVSIGETDWCRPKCTKKWLQNNAKQIWPPTCNTDKNSRNGKKTKADKYL